jgi:hypothetical protein
MKVRQVPSFEMTKYWKITKASSERVIARSSECRKQPSFSRLIAKECCDAREHSCSGLDEYHTVKLIRIQRLVLSFS